MNHLSRLRTPRPGSVVVVAAVLALLLTGCSVKPGPTDAANPGHSMPVPASIGPRPPSPATVEIVKPAAGDTVTGAVAHIVLKLNGARIIMETTTAIRPDEGHVHLYVDNSLVSMNYGLEQDVPVTPGSHVMKAEFVAADHAPFNPRVWSAETVFTVRQ
jgi:hypothetical protein